MHELLPQNQVEDEIHVAHKVLHVQSSLVWT